LEYAGDSRLPEKFRREPGIPRLVELSILNPEMIVD
jgi:hypothetical protein